LKINIYLIW